LDICVSCITALLHCLHCCTACADLLLLQEYLLCGFDFVLAPLVQPGHEQPALQLPQDGSAVEPRIRSELMLTSAAWGGQVGGAQQAVNCSAIVVCCG
jgi:hypothetical protein